MTAHLTSRRVALVAAAGFLAALSFGGGAQAVTDPIFKYTAKKNGYFGIDAMAISPGSDTAADDCGIDWGVHSGVTTSAVRCFNAGVNLPHGATITQLSIWTTSGAGSNPETWLYRHKLSDGDAAVVASRSIADDSATRKLTNIGVSAGSVAVVNNRDYSYGFGVCIGSADKFHAARIRYTYTHAGA